MDSLTIADALPFLALLGPHTMSNVSPLCAAKRTSTVLADEPQFACVGLTRTRRLSRLRLRDQLTRINAQSLCKLRTGGIAPRSMRLCADTKKTGNAAPKPDRPPHHHARVPNLGKGSSRAVVCSLGRTAAGYPLAPVRFPFLLPQGRGSRHRRSLSSSWHRSPHPAPSSRFLSP
jgi:hypothetical protein